MKRISTKNSILVLVRPFLITVGFVALASLLRIWPLQILEYRIPWVTFYPAVMASALLGGLYAGLLGTVLSCLIIYFPWAVFTDQPFIQNFADWLGMGVFFINCSMISAIAEGTRRAQRRARRSQEQAEAANRAKTVFLANMSHELRTPLNAVIGFSNLLRNDPEATPAQVDKLNIIIKSGEHLLNLINNILDISKIESGHILLEEANFDLKQLIREVYILMDVNAAEKGLSLALETDPDLPQTVFADGAKLRQVLINLLANAIKYTPAGKVRLRATLLQGEPTRPARLRFEVEDTGPGIPPGDRRRIFEPFVQLDLPARVESGTGLGLAICRQYVELMGGQIGVGDAAHQGSLFYFEIPAVIVSQGDAKNSLGDKYCRGLAPGQPCYRLLVAEDNPENRLLLYHLLEPLGFEMCSAANGLEAVELFESFQPDLIWMDVRMPHLNGLQATRRIKATPTGKRTRIIALTAHALEAERLEILNAGCDDFIRKPYREADIFQALERHLGVEFLYHRTASNQPDLDLPISAQALSHLSPEQIEELTRAAELLDQTLCLQVIDRCASSDPTLAESLRNLVKTFRFQEILKSLTPFEKETQQ